MIQRGPSLLILLLLAGQSHAHSVPSITMEAVFNKDRTFEMRVNIDPRLIISDKPTTLPPVEATWYREQTPDQQRATHLKADEYLRHTVLLQFGEKAMVWPEPSFQPMDGATNTPMNDNTKELHLLATVHGKAPEGGFQVGLGSDANTSLILLNSLDGTPERRPQVIFAGEKTRPFVLPAANLELPPASPMMRPTEKATAPPPDTSWAAWFIVAVAVLWGLRRLTRNMRSA